RNTNGDTIGVDLSREMRGIAAAARSRADPCDGELLVAVLAGHLVARLHITLLLLEADVTGVESGVQHAVAPLDDEKAEFLAGVRKTVIVGVPIAYLGNRNGHHPVHRLHLFKLAHAGD